MLWTNAGSFPSEASTEMAAWTTSGFTFKYSQAIDVTTFDYTPIVTQLINHGVQYVQFDGPTQYAVRLAQAMKAQSFSPLFVVGSLTGDVPFDSAGGADVAGAYRFTDLLQADASSREYQLYVHWLHVVAPDAVPTAAGEYAWSAALLFTQRAMALGGQLSRANLTTSLGQTTTWSGDAMQWTETVNAKKPSACATILHLTSGVWHGVGGGCGALTSPAPPPGG
jgi:ABC-type branched-subunit amino acid transport system substrate-binding protein